MSFCRRVNDAAIWMAVMFIVVCAAVRPAHAVPSFAIQTGQPCAACHVGAFGPQLTSFGRDFKLYGYTASDKQVHFPPLAMVTQVSYGHTQADASSPVADGARLNDNWALNQTSLYLAGVLVPDHVGAFVQGTYDGVARTFNWDNTDIRYVHGGELFDEDLVWGISANNSPTVQDIWNSTPAWGFPYTSSPWDLGSAPPSALIDGTVGFHVVGVGAYMMWNDTIYVESSLYRQLGSHDDNLLNGAVQSNSAILSGVAPYWRAAVQQSWDKGRYYLQVGTYGMTASVNPGGDTSTGLKDHYTDYGFDTNFQWYLNPKSVTADVLSAHATVIHEDQNLAASSVLYGTDAGNTLVTSRADVSYAIGATWIPTVQYFKTTGSYALGSGTQKPNTDGWIAELGYVPWGKPDSPVNFANVRVTLQYVNYNEFQGTSTHATDNNTVFLNFWFALGLNPW